MKDNVKTSKDYKQELEEALSLSVSQTLKEVMEQESYGIEDRNQFIAAFLQALVMRMNSDADMTVSVISADMEKGMLDIEVKERIMDLEGRTGERKQDNAPLDENIALYEGDEVVVRRTVIFDHSA